MIYLKHIFTLLLAFMLTPVHAIELESEKEKLSYTMGVFFGDSISQQNIDIDIPAFLQAAEDILRKNELKLTTEEMQKIFVNYQKKNQEMKEAQAETNKQKGKEYLAENKKKENVNELSNGIQYEIIKKGEGKKPTAESTVVVHYRGTLIDGTEFDSSYARGEPAEFAINQVIKGWQEVLQLMPEGSKWKVAIPYDLAYGERGAGAGIGPYETLLFDIELISIK